MSAVQQLEQELQNELTTSNQLLTLISMELKQIKQFTMPGGELEENIKKNATINAALAHIQQLDLEKLPPIKRLLIGQQDTLEGNQNQNGRH